MKTGSSGTFVISWSQSEVDGLVSAPVTALTVGANWRWSGEAICVDGQRDILVLKGALGADELRARAARNVRRLLGDLAEGADAAQVLDDGGRLFDGAFDVTDGTELYTITLIDLPHLDSPLLMFMGVMPPRDTDLWVVQQQAGQVHRDLGADAPGGVICFTPGTRIMTGDGARRVEELTEGDLVQTKDNGLQPLRWIGSRRLSGARLYAMPALRPIRLRAGALGLEVPDEELIVSPQHRIILRGAPARDLFNADEILVSAGDLVNDHSITVDHRLREVTYIHLMLEQHEILFANGVETESFHPAGAEMATLPPEQMRRLQEAFPDVAAHAEAFGAYARRTLSAAEAAILLHRVA